MIFMTVGTLFSFDRLVMTVDEAVGEGLIEEPIFAQVGPGGFRPDNMEYAEVLDKEQFDDYFEKAEAVISHAGMGTISMALNSDKPLLVMPRMKKYGEHVNDHQVDTARRFEELGHVLAVLDELELVRKVKELKDFKPAKRSADREGVVNYLRGYLEGLQKKIYK